MHGNVHQRDIRWQQPQGQHVRHPSPDQSQAAQPQRQPGEDPQPPGIGVQVYPDLVVPPQHRQPRQTQLQIPRRVPGDTLARERLQTPVDLHRLGRGAQARGPAVFRKQRTGRLQLPGVFEVFFRQASPAPVGRRFPRAPQQAHRLAADRYRNEQSRRAIVAKRPDSHDARRGREEQPCHRQIAAPPSAAGPENQQAPQDRRVTDHDGTRQDRQAHHGAGRDHPSGGTVLQRRRKGRQRGGHQHRPQPVRQQRLGVVNIERRQGHQQSGGQGGGAALEQQPGGQAHPDGRQAAPQRLRNAERAISTGAGFMKSRLHQSGEKERISRRLVAAGGVRAGRRGVAETTRGGQISRQPEIRIGVAISSAAIAQGRRTRIQIGQPRQSRRQQHDHQDRNQIRLG